MVQSVQSLRVEQKEWEAPAELAEQRCNARFFCWFEGAQQSVCLNKPYVMITYWEVLGSICVCKLVALMSNTATMGSWKPIYICHSLPFLLTAKSDKQNITELIAMFQISRMIRGTRAFQKPATSASAAGDVSNEEYSSAGVKPLKAIWGRRITSESSVVLEFFHIFLSLTLS